MSFLLGLIMIDVFVIFILLLPNVLHLLRLLRFTLLQGLLSMERISVIIQFLPVLFNQLFKVLTQNDNDEVTTATTRLVYGTTAVISWGLVIMQKARKAHSSS